MNNEMNKLFEKKVSPLTLIENIKSLIDALMEIQKDKFVKN